MSSSQPDYILSIKYVTPELLKKLRGRYKNIPPKEAYAVLIPEGEIGKGAKSRIYVFENAFPNRYRSHPQSHTDLDVIISNTILKNGFTNAKYFNQGIPNYPRDLFRDSNGKFNELLYVAIIEILSCHAEYSTLLKNPRINSSNFLSLYAKGIREVVSKHLYRLLFDEKIILGMDKKLIERLKRDFEPSKLFN